MFLPQQIDKAQQAFPARVSHLMPTNEPDYQSDYRKGYHSRDTWGFKLFNDWFYSGLTKLELIPKEGVDKNAAVVHIRTVMGSFEPSHEDKTASVAWMLEHWFESATWEKKERD